MAVFCIPKHLVEKLKTSALKGEVNIKELYTMSTEQRRAFFTKFTDGELGKFINTEFEKAMVSKQKDALTQWAKSVFSPTEQKKPVYQNVLDKIRSLDELGVLSPKSEQAFLQDLVAEKLGITVSPEEVVQIAERAKKIDAAQIALGDRMGDPEYLKENLDFFEAKKGMDDYLLSLTPSSKLKIMTGTFGRGMMLASVKSPILNIGSNTELAITEALTRRLSSGAFRGTDNKLAVDYVKFVNKVYQKTGYDLSRMENLSDAGASGARVLGDTVHSQGPGMVRKAGRVVEDIVFKQLMGAPDAAFAASHFADSVNTQALKLAKGDRVKAREMMVDAMRIEPKTAQGEILRQQGILDAQTATWTNETWGSRVSLGIRKILNEVSGDLRVGDQLMPFVKTPANVIATGMDYAGLGVPKALFDTVKAFREGELGSKEYRQKTSRNLVRAGVGLTAAVIITIQLKDDDFVGAYDPARSQIEALRNSNTNSIRVGGKWISTDWLGPLSVPVTAIMYARKYGKSPQERAFQFGKGVFSNVERLPGVSDIYDFVKSQGQNANQSLSDLEGSAFDAATNYLYSHLVPGMLGDIAKATDQYQRQTGKGLQSIQAKIPGLRQKLPIKKTIFGEQMKDESGLTNILFGSRVKTDTETPIVKELNDVSTATDKAIKFTDWDRSNSATLRQFREKFGDSGYQSGKERYAYWLRSMLEDLFNNPKYKELTNEDKLAQINQVDSNAMEKVFSQFQWKYQKLPSTKPKIKL